VCVCVYRAAVQYLDGLEGVTHHCNEHVNEDDDCGDVVERKQQHPDSLDHAGGVSSARKYVRVATVSLLARVLDLPPPSSSASS